MSRRILVFGPAYLDRVVRVDRPLHAPEKAHPLDQSVAGRWMFGEGLPLADPDGRTIDVALPDDWPGPNGRVLLSDPIGGADADLASRHLDVVALSWQDDLGGMGAGYASALGGRLIGALGAPDDPLSESVAGLVGRHGIDYEPVRLAGHAADWTLLLTSGGHGDKLPVGFRGCHAALTPASLAAQASARCDVRVVASFPNALSAYLLRAPGADVRVFAPTLRNVRDREAPLSRFAGEIDVLSCNRREWESLSDR